MKKNRAGQSMLEIIIAIGVMVMSISATSGMLLMTERATVGMLKEAQGIAIAEEGIQAAISINDRDTTSLSVGSHGLAINSSSPVMWIFSGTSDVSDGYTRTVVVSSVDADTKKVVVTVTWQPEPNRTAVVEEQVLLTNWAFI